MSNINESLLKTIDSIDDIVMESEISVLCSMMDEYTKMGMLMEYADESILQEYSIINENEFILEAFRSKSKTEEKENKDKKDKPKKENIFIRIGKAIGNAIKTVFTMIIKGYVWLVSQFVNLMFHDLEEKATSRKNLEKFSDIVDNKLMKNGRSFEDLTDDELQTILDAIDSLDPATKTEEQFQEIAKICKRTLAERKKAAEAAKLKKTRDDFKYEVVDKDTKLSDKDIESLLTSLKNLYGSLQHDTIEMNGKHYDAKKLEELWKKHITDSSDNKIKEAVKNIEKQNKSLKLTFDNAFKNGHFTPLGFLNKFIDDIMWIGNNLDTIDDKFTKRIDQAISYPCIYTEISTARNNERIKLELEEKLNKLKGISIRDAKTKIEDKPDLIQNVSNMINSKLLPYVSKQTAEMFAYNHAIVNIYKELG